MADSLQDQLRALGLAKQSEKRSKNKPSRERNKNKHRRPANPAPSAQEKKGGEMPLDKAWALRARDEKHDAAQTRARKREEDRKRREINQAIRAVVKPNRLNREDAEVSRNFMFRERIRKVYVTPDQHKALSEGKLGLVYLSGGYHVLAPQHVETIRGIDAAHVIDLAGDEPEDEEFPVPDDLLW